MGTTRAGAWLVTALVAIAACGGSSVVDGSGGATTTATGPSGPCTDHADCPGQVCVFGTGECRDACAYDDPCAAGWVCNECATSSCPGCRDCVGACLPATANGCDDHDDCSADWVCVYSAQQCAPPCTSGGGCDDASLTCDNCATSSCPSCEDCRAACTAAF